MTGVTDNPTTTIVVGADGSSNASHALDTAIWLATSTGSELLVVHALGLTSVLNGEHVLTEGNEDAIEKQLREVWCGPLAEVEGLSWHSELRYGSPADALLSAARDGASMVVVGTRGMREDSDHLLGSTSHHVVHRCPCPVVVVPPLVPEEQ
jgi:nucleotide-binding universal stress UspA family protein